MSCGRSCVSGVHVFMMAYLAICSDLLEDIFFLDDMFYLNTYFTGGHIVLDDSSYSRTPLI